MRGSRLTESMNQANIDRIPHSCLLRIQSVYDDLKPAERKAVDLILSIPEEIQGMTIVEFGEHAGCSIATVVRVSRRLGYEGFPELKRDFVHFDAAANSQTAYPDIRLGDDPMVVAKKVFDMTVAAVTDTYQVMDIKQYQKALEVLLNADRMLFCGLGDAAPVASTACHRFDRIGQQCSAPTDPDQQLVHATHLTTGDVCVAISYSGRSTTILEVMAAARASGATIIAICNYPKSPIAKGADIVLQTAVFTEDWSGEIIAKRVAELCLVESLFANFLMHKGLPALDALRKSNTVVGVHKT